MLAFLAGLVFSPAVGVVAANQVIDPKKDSISLGLGKAAAVQGGLALVGMAAAIVAPKGSVVAELGMGSMIGSGVVAGTIWGGQLALPEKAKKDPIAQAAPGMIAGAPPSLMGCAPRYARPRYVVDAPPGYAYR